MIAAPFYGEFGWEVALWAPHLRWLRKMHHNHGDFVVWCQAGHEILYADFATEVKPVWNIPDIRRRDCQNAWFHGLGIYHDPHAEVIRLERAWRIPAKRVIHHKMMQVTWDPVPCVKRAIFHKFSEGIALKPSEYGDGWEKVPGKFAIHARMCVKKQSERNWSWKKWSDLLVEHLEFEPHQMIAIGTENDALGDEGVGLDMRGQKLEHVVHALSECELIIGPSSGPLHLANQCGVPAVWWSGNEKDVPRYRHTWNPFKVKNVQAAKSWNPSVQEVVDAIGKMRDVLSGHVVGPNGH